MAAFFINIYFTILKKCEKKIKNVCYLTRKPIECKEV